MLALASRLTNSRLRPTPTRRTYDRVRTSGTCRRPNSRRTKDEFESSPSPAIEFTRRWMASPSNGRTPPTGRSSSSSSHTQRRPSGSHSSTHRQQHIGVDIELPLHRHERCIVNWLNSYCSSWKYTTNHQRNARLGTVILFCRWSVITPVPCFSKRLTSTSFSPPSCCRAICSADVSYLFKTYFATTLPVLTVRLRILTNYSITYEKFLADWKYIIYAIFRLCFNAHYFRF